MQLDNLPAALRARITRAIGETMKQEHLTLVTAEKALPGTAPGTVYVLSLRLRKASAAAASATAIDYRISAELSDVRAGGSLHSAEETCGLCDPVALADLLSRLARRMWADAENRSRRESANRLGSRLGSR